MDSSTGLATGLVLGMAISNTHQDNRTAYEKMCIKKRSTQIDDAALFGKYEETLIDTCKDNEIIASTIESGPTGTGLLVLLISILILFLAGWAFLGYAING
jgi:hypothetical protein